MRIGEREPAHDVAGRLRFAAVALQEFQPRRRRREEIARLDPRALRLRAGLNRAFDAVFDEQRDGRVGAARARADFEPRDRGDRGQRLAAKSERRDMGEIAVGNFRGRMALDAEREIAGAHADAVVDDPDQVASARLDGDVDARARRASSAFSTSSFTAAAGRSITSPAAMRSISSGSRRRMDMDGTRASMRRIERRDSDAARGEIIRGTVAAGKGRYPFSRLREKVARSAG